MDEAISKLIHYALRTGLIEKCETTWAINSLLEVLRLDGYADPGKTWGEIGLAATLDALLDDAHARGVLAEDSIVYRDLFDTAVMGRLTPRPAQVREKFAALYRESPEKATDWYYKFSQDTNYIRRDRIAKDMKWITDTEYGALDITINLSKPEKDPRAIAAARDPPASDYPRCKRYLPSEPPKCSKNTLRRMNHDVKLGAEPHLGAADPIAGAGKIHLSSV